MTDQRHSAASGRNQNLDPKPKPVVLVLTPTLAPIRVPLYRFKRSFSAIRSASEFGVRHNKVTGRGGCNTPPAVIVPKQHTQRNVGKGLCRRTPKMWLKKQEVTSLLHKARSHKERPLLKVIYAAFLCGFVPLCLCVSYEYSG